MARHVAEWTWIDSAMLGGGGWLSVCLIVRNNEHTVLPCLASIAPWVDEMVVVDTGSIDATALIVREHGAKLFQFPWCDDFAQARNESLRHASGDWIFWMDSDDTISSENGKKLRELAQRPAHESVLGYVMQVHCPTPADSEGPSVTIVDHVKMFRNHPEIRFEGRVHEQVLPSIRRLGGEIEWTDIYVEHTGSDQTIEGRWAKYERDLKLLRLELVDHPDHPFALFNLGMTYADMQDHAAAVEPLRRSIEVAGSHESHLRKAYALLVGSLGQLGKVTEAWDVCQRGRELFPEDRELQFREGILAHRLGRLEEAVNAYRSVLDPSGARYFSSFDTGILGYKARHNLALVYYDQKDFARAEAQWRLVTQEAPGFHEAWLGLCDCLIQQRAFDAVELVAGELLNGNRAADGLLMLGRIAEAREDFARARWIYSDGCRKFPNDVRLARELSRFLFEHGPLSAAISVLSKLSADFPGDGAAHHNLGTLYLQLGCLNSAADAYLHSLKVRPDSVQTVLQLGWCLEQLRKHDSAAEIYRAAMDRFPDNADIRTSLVRVNEFLPA
jgi:tetratricopeptide (TPR) repeat protein